MDTGLIAVALGLGCAFCGYMIGSGEKRKVVEDTTTIVLAQLEAAGIINITQRDNGDIHIEAGDK